MQTLKAVVTLKALVIDYKNYICPNHTTNFFSCVLHLKHDSKILSMVTDGVHRTFASFALCLVSLA